MTQRSAISGRIAMLRADHNTTRLATIVLAVLGLAGLATESAPIVGSAVILGVVLCRISADVRILWVVAGGMLVLENSQDLNITKVAYFIGAVAAFVFSAESAWRSRHTEAGILMRPVIGASGVFLIVVAGSAVTAYVHGTAVVPWFRDAVPYALFAIAPIFALDATANVNPRVLRATLITLGVLAATSFAIEWLALRHLADLALTRLLLPSYPFAVALFSYASSAALLGQRRPSMWAVVMAFVAGAVLVTGTRSGLLIGIAPIAVAVVGERARLGDRLRRLGVLVPFLLAGTLGFALAIAVATGADLGRSLQRLVSVVDIPAGVGAPAPSSAPTQPTPSDGILPFERLSPAVAAQSSNARAIQGRVAWDEFVSSPLVGTGPGRVVPWVDEFGVTHSSFNLDTPVAVPAKFGLLGVLALAACLLSMVIYVVRLSSSEASTIGAGSLIALAAVWVLTSPLSSPFEDKGFSFGLLLLLALSLPSATADARRSLSLGSHGPIAAAHVRE